MPSARIVAVLAALGLAFSAAASPAHAESVTLVLDRGAGARAGAEAHRRLALDLAERCAARGHALKVIAVGARASGRPRVIDLRVPLDAAALAELDGKEGVAFDGPSDVRAALAATLRGTTPRGALTVVFIGPFGRVDPTPEGAGFALETWARTAPPGSRLLPLALAPDAAALLRPARGYEAAGHVTLQLGPLAATVEAWSAFAESPVLRARVVAPLRTISWGSPAPAPPGLRPVGGPDDVFTADPSDGTSQRWTLAHPLLRGLATEVRLEVGALGTDGPFEWSLADPPPPLTIAWDAVLPEVRWLDGAGAAPSLEAFDLVRGTPRDAGFRYRRTAEAEPSGWLRLVERTPADAPPPLELEVQAAEERRVSPALVEGVLRVTVTPGAPRAGAVTGHVDLVPEGPGAGAPLRLAYRLGYAPARVTVALDAPPPPLPLPPADTDAPLALRVARSNANAPDTVALVWQGGPPGLSLRVRRGEEPEEVWRNQEPLSVSTDTRLRLRLVVTEPFPADWRSVYRGDVRFAAAEPGAPVDVPDALALAPRDARWVLESAEAAYRAGATSADDERLLRVRLDGGGADGAFLAWLLDQPPTVEQAPGAPQVFALERTAPGRYELRRRGDWGGARGGIFDDRTERVGVRIAGLGGTAFEGEVPVTVPARWGRVGYVLAALAGLAVLLGVVALVAHRVAPLTGTLLYTVEGRGGAVGRLPLASAGRRRTPLTVDGSGRLSLGGRGPVLARLVPTRVGGMLEVPGDDGKPARRLLVEGLTVLLGRHALRYVQGGGDAPPDSADGATAPGAPRTSPDLLGPEYDLPTSTSGVPPSDVR